jgi:uncharacterized membrane protein YeaQ/YmgE (transglycosylase-associated protein family)
MAENSDFIFGKKLGNKFQNTKQRFILEAMMFSLMFLILGDLAGTIYTLFFVKVGIVVKIIAAISGSFGAVFMLMILISTFQSYKSYLEIMAVQNVLSSAVDDVNTELKEVKGGLNETTT